MLLTRFTVKECNKLNFFKIWARSNSKSPNCAAEMVNGLVLGVYDKIDGECEQEFSIAGERLSESTNGMLKELLRKRYVPLGKAELYSGLGICGMQHVAFASVGTKNPNKLNFAQQLNDEKENIRVAMAVGARLLQDHGANKIFVDGCTVPEAAAEGAILATYKYKSNLTCGDKTQPQVLLYEHPDTTSWASGEINAEAQNYARFLSHAPPNLKLPVELSNEIMDRLCKFDIKVDIRHRDWMYLRRMTSTLALTKGSCKSPLLVEIGYCGDDPTVRPIVMVGKGNICDSGGMFIKPYKGLHEFRADMAGAAAICGTIMGVARKRLPINVRGALILYQNMPSPMGLKPGDIVRDKNGMHIRVSNPDNDCRVVLSDIISFTEYYNPSMIIGVGTFTSATGYAFGLGATATFAADNQLWNELQRAGLESGDRLWRLPFWNHFGKLNTKYSDVDMDNGTDAKGSDICQAAAFLKKFVPLEQHCCCPAQVPYIHIDCFNTGLLSQNEEEIEPYYRRGYKMGRPTRALIQFLYQRACLLPRNDKKA